VSNSTPAASELPDLGALGAEALDYARHHWPVFPLNGKVPAISKRIGGRGVLDATTDLAIVTAWWSGRYAGCNIGLRLPEHIIVIDIDPRNGGLEALAALETKYGPLPETLMTVSGRGDGGRHLYFRRPPGTLSAKRLGAGVDIKTSSGYVVAAPSVHPATGKPYQRIDAPVATPPAWLIELLGPEPVTVARPRQRGHLRLAYTGPSIADEFNARTSWAAILENHGWTCRDVNPDAAGARWLHPRATSECSATIGRDGRLYVYSTNTPFEPTSAGDKHGYSKFHAYAVLEHGGDMKAAARHLRGVKF
jgi:Bifunctional DNA primase/polymerase, N-terminal